MLARHIPAAVRRSFVHGARNAGRNTRRTITTTTVDSVNGSPEYVLSTLDSGLRVVTSPAPSHFPALGIYVHAGSRLETPELSGVSHIVDRLAFKSTKSSTVDEVEERLFASGGNFMCSSARENIMYQATVFPDKIESMFQSLSETVAEPAVTADEVVEQLETARYEIDEIWQKPDLILPEIAHMTAFSDGIGNPLLCPEDRLSAISRDTVLDYREKFVRPERIVAAFVGIPHEQSLELVDKYLASTLPAATGSADTTPVRSTYKGGEVTVPMPRQIGNQEQFHQLHVMFRGLSLSDPDVYAIATLQTLLGGGGAFSAGGPGKGMYSRLYTDVLNRYGFIESCLGVNHLYSDDGLFGIQASSIIGGAAHLPYVIGNQLALLMSRGEGGLNYTEVQRAKAQTRSSLLMNLESKLVELEDLGRQVQLHGRKVPVHEMCARIDALTPADLTRVAERVLTSSPPTIVMQGPREEFGDVQKVLEGFGLGAKKGWFK